MQNKIKTHAAEAYEKWLREQVQEAIDDPRPPIPHKQVIVEMRALIATKRKQLADFIASN